MARKRLINPYTPRHEFPPDLRRRHTLRHVHEVGIGAIAHHPLPYRRPRPGLAIGVSLAVFLGLGLVGGTGMARAGQPFWIPPAAGLGCWLALVGLPIILPQSLARAARRRRVERVLDAMPAHRGAAHTVPGQLGKDTGVVTYHGGWLRTATPGGTAAAIPFADIALAEELPGKGFWGFPGVDIMNRAGEWTEIRTTDNRELLDTLEHSGVPVLRTAKGIR
ncbi:hypothetical protein [Streptomyces sp. PT12]|uniref:hypothetical protein n=1 Tax=Streptomyces sp. PT12 TaxID=1510197 RepID=UPI000DE49FBE|nr:hypothetical protein [Streptomyces sp. PT12]RBM19065.1 hypothetical protein DEH69_11710 [Streptomyces sp. PT12]